jgi:simple sugar transport system substrate-binding protein
MNNYTIATVVKIYPHPWFDRMKKGLERFSTETGHKTFLVGPPRIDEKMEEQTLKDVLAQNVNAVCVVVYFPQAIEMVLSTARQRGTIIISHEAPNLRNSDYDIEAFDNTEYGVRLMNYLAQYMAQEGEYAVLFESLLTKSHSEWAISAIAYQQKTYSKLHLSTGKIEHHEDQTVAYTKMQGLLKSYPNLKGVLALGGAGLVGAAQAIEDAGLQGKVKIVGNCLMCMGGDWLKKGVVQLCSFWDPADIGYAMNKLAVMALQGDRVSQGMDLGVPGYHQINLDGKVLYGSAWIDVTKENMTSYNF